MAIPTETVYGLAADALSAEAVAKIFEAKGRPATNPLIVHVRDAAMARRFVKGWDPRAEALARAFWPGPLTLVLPKTAAIPELVTAGGPTVGVRAPSHPVAQAVLAAFGGPLAAPSANRSMSISPTSAAAVSEELGDRIPLIVDGGPCSVGLESTVLDLSEPTLRVLRPGHVRAEEIGALLGAPVLGPGSHTPSEAVARSPGLMRRHYAPSTPTRLFAPAELQAGWDSRIVYLTYTLDLPPGVEGRRMPQDPVEYARTLYGALRWADALGAEALWVEAPPGGERWAAIHDRLERAATDT